MLCFLFSVVFVFYDLNLIMGNILIDSGIPNIELKPRF